MMMSWTVRKASQKVSLFFEEPTLANPLFVGVCVHQEASESFNQKGKHGECRGDVDNELDFVRPGGELAAQLAEKEESPDVDGSAEEFAKPERVAVVLARDEAVVDEVENVHGGDQEQQEGHSAAQRDALALDQVPAGQRADDDCDDREGDHDLVPEEGEGVGEGGGLHHAVDGLLVALRDFGHYKKKMELTADVVSLLLTAGLDLVLAGALVCCC